MAVDSTPTRSSRGFSCPFTLPCECVPKRILTITLVAVTVLAVVGVLFLILWSTGCLPLIIAYPFITLSCIFGALTAIATFGLIIGVCCRRSSPPKELSSSDSSTTSSKQTTSSTTKSSTELMSTPPSSKNSSISEPLSLPPSPRDKVISSEALFQELIQEIFESKYGAQEYANPIDDPKALFDQKDLPALLFGKTTEGHRWIQIKTISGTGTEKASDHFFITEQEDPPVWKGSQGSEEIENLDENAKRLLIGIVKGEKPFTIRLNRSDTESEDESEESSKESSLEA